MGFYCIWPLEKFLVFILSQFFCRIFDSQTYQREELTIFHSSLIEDTVAKGKSCLSGKYAGAYILIHPAYQRGNYFNLLY